MIIKNLAIGKPKEYEWKDGKEYSAIDKQSIKSASLLKSGFIHDDVANHQFHGGDDRAVCLYPFEHYQKWEHEFGVSLMPPALGENITAIGMPEESVCIGDIYQVNDCLLQVTQGRVPCSTISKFNQEDQFLNRVFQTCFTGYFFRVLREGEIYNGSEIKLIQRHPQEISVLFANHILFHDQKNKAAIEKILLVDELAEVWKGKLHKLLL
ncbi:MAG: MOSC domain-containing protein [Bacillota bacterium]|nr:MOSC domain-containing protein [Bacillota bacterium]